MLFFTLPEVCLQRLSRWEILLLSHTYFLPIFPGPFSAQFLHRYHRESFPALLFIHLTYALLYVYGSRIFNGGIQSNIKDFYKYA